MLDLMLGLDPMVDPDLMVDLMLGLVLIFLALEALVVLFVM